jgi:hypothetical protein
LIEIRKPWNSSIQMASTVPAVPSVRVTALPTSPASASSNAWRIVNAQRFAVVTPASVLIAMLPIFGNENRSAKNHPLAAR